jgi:hypothetical protein
LQDQHSSGEKIPRTAALPEFLPKTRYAFSFSQTSTYPRYAPGAILSIVKENGLCQATISDLFQNQNKQNATERLAFALALKYYRLSPIERSRSEQLLSFTAHGAEAFCIDR